MTSNSSSALPEALERRPEARAFKVEDLLYELSQGRMRIPPFQRPLRWDRKDAMQLIDSIYRGYPVGTLLFWKTSAEAGEVRIVPSLTFLAQSRSDALWVVDGQQRIVSLARILLSTDPESDNFFLYFDLDEQHFIVPPSLAKLDNDPGRWLPMNEVLDAERLMQWLLDHANTNVTTDATTDGRERRSRAVRLGKRIRDYEIPAYLVRTEKEQILREVFSRINESGKKLKASEVFDALHGARNRTSPATIKEIARDLDSLEFGHIDEDKVLYRLLMVLQGNNAIKKTGKSPLRLNEDEAGRAYHDTEQAAKRAIQFIHGYAEIPYYDLLPYKQPLITLGKFFHHHPEPKQRSLELLARWVWRGALSGVHQGDTASTRIILDRIIADDEEISVQRLLEQVGDAPHSLPEITAPFNFRWARSKLLTLALLSLKPRDLETGQLIKPSDLQENDSGFHLPQLIPTNSKLTLSNALPNRFFHPKRQGLRRILLQVTETVILRSHGITDDAIQLLREDDTELFLELRAEYLQHHFKLFFARQARWEESDRPSINALLISDEDE